MGFEFGIVHDRLGHALSESRYFLSDRRRVWWLLAPGSTKAAMVANTTELVAVGHIAVLTQVKYSPLGFVTGHWSLVTVIDTYTAAHESRMTSNESSLIGVYRTQMGMAVCQR